MMFHDPMMLIRFYVVMIFIYMNFQHCCTYFAKLSNSDYLQILLSLVIQIICEDLYHACANDFFQILLRKLLFDFFIFHFSLM